MYLVMGTIQKVGHGVERREMGIGMVWYSVRYLRKRWLDEILW